MRQPRNFATDRCYHLVSRIANRAFYLSAEAGGWRTTFLRFSPKGQGDRSRFATCSDFPVRTTSRRSTLRRCARRATLHRLARRIRIRLGWSTRSRRRGVERSQPLRGVSPRGLWAALQSILINGITQRLADATRTDALRTRQGGESPQCPSRYGHMRPKPHNTIPNPPSTAAPHPTTAAWLVLRLRGYSCATPAPHGHTPSSQH